MHAMHCALHSLSATTTALTLVGPSQFARALEGAAGRAWLRRVSSQTNPYAAFPSTPETKPKSIKNGPARGRSRRRNKITLPHEANRDISNHPMKLASPDLTEPRPTHSPTSELSTILSLPFPVSPQMFYSNLRFASFYKPPPDVEQLINYHDSHPHFQSPKTYNICINFAISHEQYDAANRLFDTMTKAKIHFDSVTYQLLVRLHARQSSGLVQDPSDRPILRKGSQTVVKILSLIRDSDLKVAPEEFLRRILDCLRPMFSGWEVHPKVVKAALYSIINKDLTLAAVELASAYFSSLPRDIDEETREQCLDMIHLLLNINMGDGLQAFVANQKLLKTLLKTHPSLQPSSQTLFMLLRPLKRAKKSGTVAMKLMKSFLKSWGDGVVDDRVSDRVMKLAEKEGRPDIVEKMRGWRHDN